MEKKGTRNAEKDRSISTCDFADRIFEVSLDKLKDLSPKFLKEKTLVVEEKSKEKAFEELFRNSQTVFGAILKFDAKKDDLKVISLGVGTKFLTSAKGDDSRVPDLHAEALCQLGFVRHLYANQEKDGQIEGNVTYHMYVSTAPCGNSCIRKWAKCSLGSRFEGRVTRLHF